MIFRLMLALFFIVSSVFLVSSQNEIRPSEIIVFTSGQIKASVSFYNSGDAAMFTGELNNGHVALVSSSIQVNENSYGSFSLVIDANASPGVYFDELNIKRGGVSEFDVPTVFVVESLNREREYDALIDINSNDLSFIQGDLIVSPNIKIFKLNFNPPPSDIVILNVHFYSLDGELVYSSAESVSVSQQAIIERSYNLGAVSHEDLLMAVVVENDATTGIDLERFNTDWAMGLSFSPPVSYSFFSLFLYFSIVFLLLGFLILTILYLSRYVRRRKNNLKLSVIKIK